MPNQYFDEKQLSTMLLNAHKLSASALTTLVLESSDMSIRQDAMQILNKTFEHQKMLWDYMSGKGFYQVEMAPPQDITRAQQQIQQMQ